MVGFAHQGRDGGSNLDADRVERFKVSLAHPRERQSVEPGVVGDETGNAPARLLGDAPFRHAEEGGHRDRSTPLALGAAHQLRRPVGTRKLVFLVHRHAGEIVIERIAEDHEDRFHPLRADRVLPQAGRRAAAWSFSVPIRSAHW